MNINEECVKYTLHKANMDSKEWIVLLWLTVGYFLTLVFLVTGTAMIVEWLANKRRISEMAENLTSLGIIFLFRCCEYE